jgi:hypothetical protein
MISYSLMGRFGNNLFQYFAMKIIQKYTNDEYVFLQSNMCDQVEINDANYREHYEKLVKGSDHLKGKNILIHGYFQFDQHLLNEKKYVVGLFSADNNDRINYDYLVSQVYDYVSHYKNPFIEGDLVVHLRLDDFKYQGEIIKPECYDKVIESYPYTTLYIVCDVLRYQYEFDYFDHFKKYKYVHLCGKQIEDFARLYYAPNLVVSCSTFSWIAGFLGHSKNSWLPNKLQQPHQSFHKLNDGSKGFDVTYEPKT